MPYFLQKNEDLVAGEIVRNFFIKSDICCIFYISSNRQNGEACKCLKMLLDKLSQVDLHTCITSISYAGNASMQVYLRKPIVFTRPQRKVSAGFFLFTFRSQTCEQKSKKYT